MKRLILLWLLFAALLPWAAVLAQSLEIIDLRHRPAEEVVPLLRPFLAPGGTLTGQRGQLFIRTTPANLAELKKLLAELDKTLRQLQITVLQGEAVHLAEDEARLNADTTTGGRGRVALGEKTAPESIELRVRRSRSRNRSEDVQRVRVMEGNPATIYLGQSIPVASRSITTTPGGVQSSDTIEYRQVATGFAVVPRISGDSVTLEIATQRDRLSNSGGGRIDFQGVQTTVSGRLGEWIEIGGAVSLETQRRSGVIYRSTDQSSDTRRVLLKVEELP